MRSKVATPLAWYKCQNSQSAQKCLGRVRKVFVASGVRVPKQSLAWCETVFWGVLPGAKQGLDGARDSFGTIGPERPNHF